MEESVLTDGVIEDLRKRCESQRTILVHGLELRALLAELDARDRRLRNLARTVNELTKLNTERKKKMTELRAAIQNLEKSKNKEQV